MKSVSALVSFLALVVPGLSQEITMGIASTFAVVAVSGITSTGTSVITGDMGTIDREITGFPPGLLVGTQADASAASDAHADAVAAWTAARALNATALLKPTALDGPLTTITPGVYLYEQGASIDGIVTLDGAGTFVFQIPSSLASVDNSQVVLTNGALATDVFWTTGNEIVLGANSTIVGSLITDTEIILGEGAVVNGGLFAGSSITLVSNTITA